VCVHVDVHVGADTRDAFLVRRVGAAAGAERALRRWDPAVPLRHAGEKTIFFSDCLYKIIILPRQARDKHRESSKTEAVFVGIGVPAAEAGGRAGVDDGGAGALLRLPEADGGGDVQGDAEASAR
jgi:hypothetical protein